MSILQTGHFGGNAKSEFDEIYCEQSKTRGTMGNDKKTLVEMCRSYTHRQCSVHDLPLYQICLDKKCQNFFKVSCDKCPAESHSHLAQEMGNLKQVLTSWSEQTLSASQNLSQPLPTAIEESLKIILKDIDKLTITLTILKQNILTKLEEFYPKTNPKFLIKKYLKELFEYEQENYLIDNLKKIQKLVEVDDNSKKITIIQPKGNCGPKFQQAETYIKRISQQCTQISDQLQTILKESINSLVEVELPMSQGTMDWIFQKSKSYNSHFLKEILSGTLYQGSQNGYQIIYSNKSFKTSKHKLFLQIESANHLGYQNVVYIGIIKDSDDENYKGAFGNNGCRKCLFNDSQENQMVMLPNAEKLKSMKSLIDDGDILEIELDIEEGIFAVQLKKKDKIYCYQSTDQIKEMIQKNQWRFVVEFYNSGTKVRALSTE